MEDKATLVTVLVPGCSGFKTSPGHCVIFSGKILYSQATLMLVVNSVMDKHSIQGGAEILLVTLWLGNREKLRLDEASGSTTEFTSTFCHIYFWALVLQNKLKRNNPFFSKIVMFVSA